MRRWTTTGTKETWLSERMKKTAGRCETHAFLSYTHNTSTRNWIHFTLFLLFHLTWSKERLQSWGKESQKAEHASTPRFCLAQQRYCIMNGGSRASQPLRDRQIRATVGLWMTSPATATSPHRPTPVHIYISKALPSVYIQRSSAPLAHPLFEPISQPLANILNHPLLPPHPLLYSCSSFMFPLRSLKTPVPVDAVGKLEVGTWIVTDYYQAAIVNNSLILLKQCRLR
jgi:hypothetical protein